MKISAVALRHLPFHRSNTLSTETAARLLAEEAARRGVLDPRTRPPFDSNVHAPRTHSDPK